jgi:HlyD family secretion protein
MKLFVVVIVLIGLAWAGWRYGGEKLAGDGDDAVRKEALFTVRRGDLDVIVVENGYLKAKNSKEVSPEFQREAVITWLVEEGKSVEKDEPLAEFDKTELETQVDDIEKQLLQAQNDLASAKADLEIQRRDSTATIESAEFNLKVMRLKLERHDKGDVPDQKRKLDLQIEKAESEYARAQERFKQVPELEREGFMTKIQAEQERIKLRESELNLESARREFELWEQYSMPMEREQHLVNVKDQERQLVNAREKADISVREKETRVSRAESQLKQTEQRLEKLKKELDKMTIRAPQPGIVHYGDPTNPWEREQVKVGNRFWRGNTMFTLPDLREMQVLIQVHEADIDLVKVDQVAIINVESVKDRAFTGKVTRINAVASSDWMNENNKSFGCEVTMDPIDVELRAGITAKVEVQVEKLVDVVHVPIHAVFAEGGESFCFVPQAPAWARRTVKVAKNNAHYVVIEEGLAAGEQVLLYDPRDGEATEGGEDDEAEGGPEPAPVAALPGAGL